jgi:hypothetical protein
MAVQWQRIMSVTNVELEPHQLPNTRSGGVLWPM